MSDQSTLRCRRCGRALSTGLVAGGRRACCLNATPIAGTCPEHGPVGTHDAVEAVEESGREAADD